MLVAIETGPVGATQVETIFGTTLMGFESIVLVFHALRTATSRVCATKPEPITVTNVDPFFKRSGKNGLDAAGAPGNAQNRLRQLETTRTASG
jgi:hypothetical protein